MHDPQSLALLAEHMSRTGIEVLEVRDAAGRFRLVADAADAPDTNGAAPGAGTVRPPSPPAPVPAETVVVAAGIGRLRRHHPGRTGFEAAEGDAVRQGQVLAFLAAGALLQPVLAPCDGVLGAALAAENALIGHGDRLFTIRSP